VDSLIKDLHKTPLLRNGTQKDLEAITVLILVQVSRNADSELKDIVIHMRHSNSEKKNEEDDENCKNTAALLVKNKSEIALGVSVIMKKLSGSAEMVMDKFK
jgi:3-deoxy-D-arabino-heptulosonate 7-phosphate (DAHP) synthase